MLVNMFCHEAMCWIGDILQIAGPSIMGQKLISAPLSMFMPTCGRPVKPARRKTATTTHNTALMWLVININKSIP